MRIRVSKKAIVVAALVLAVVIPSSRHAYTWFRRISANRQLNVNGRLDYPENSSDPQVLLAEANRLYWLNNGPRSAPLYAKAESLFASQGDPEAFEKEVNRLVAELKTSHTGFRHAGMRNIPARHAINATLHRLTMNGTERWMFQDVHRGGPAYLAGIRPGDLLLGYGEREIRPPEDLNFSAGESAQLTVQKLDGGVQGVTLQLPMPKSKKHPVTAPEAVHAEMLTDEIGLLKVAMFPGAIGIDVAKDIDRGIASLDGCSRLIVDLRGNTGGGIGGLRLMSYLTPGKLEVGYSLTRKCRERGYRREDLTRFGRIPSRKSTLFWLAARYAFVDKSILVVTEGLGPRRFHGRVVLMVNEHTASAGEMVSAFAEENNLATIVGTKTPGRLLSGGAFKVGHGYIRRLPPI